MANMLQDFSANVSFGVTLRPQTFSSTAGGLSVDTSNLGSNLLSCLLNVGAVNTLTSFVCKMQASADNSNWDDISGATFTSITTLNQQQVINFFMPKASSVSANPYRWVRIYGTLTGTSVDVCAFIVGMQDFSTSTGTSNAPPVLN